MEQAKPSRWLSVGVIVLGVVLGVWIGSSSGEADAPAPNPDATVQTEPEAAKTEVRHPAHQASAPAETVAEVLPVEGTPSGPDDTAVEPDQPAYCRTTEDCGLSLACVDHGCVACTASAQCSTTEVCVKGSCVPSVQAACQTDRECSGGETCVLSDLSDDHRNNAELRSRCGGFEPPVLSEAEENAVNQPIADIAPIPVVESAERLEALEKRVLRLNKVSR